MHYSDKSFTKNGRPTIEAKNRNIHQLGNTELSELDIKQTNLVYSCDSEYLYIFFVKESLSRRDLCWHGAILDSIIYAVGELIKNSTAVKLSL